MQRYRTEYRINKKGAECFRTQDHEQALMKLAELQAKKPGIYTLQTRTAQVNKYGVCEQFLDGRTNWSSWR